MNIKNQTTNCNGLSEFSVVYNGSAGVEEDGQHGVSHLIEHCMCEEVKAMESKMLEAGISWNAFTSSTEICFHISGLSEKVKELMCEFARKIITYKIPKEIFEREKNVVLTEYNSFFSKFPLLLLLLLSVHFRPDCLPCRWVVANRLMSAVKGIILPNEKG